MERSKLAQLDYGWQMVQLGMTLGLAVLCLVLLM
jgi:hypothetical protein